MKKLRVVDVGYVFCVDRMLCTRTTKMWTHRASNVC